MRDTGFPGYTSRHSTNSSLVDYSKQPRKAKGRENPTVKNNTSLVSSLFRCCGQPNTSYSKKKVVPQKQVPKQKNLNGSPNCPTKNRKSRTLNKLTL